MFKMLGVFAGFERSMIQERARAQGKTLGRPQTEADTEAAIRTTLADGIGILKTARLHGVGTSVVQRIKAEMRAIDQTAA